MFPPLTPRPVVRTISPAPSTAPAALPADPSRPYSLQLDTAAVPRLLHLRRHLCRLHHHHHRRHHHHPHHHHHHHPHHHHLLLHLTPLLRVLAHHAQRQLLRPHLSTTYRQLIAASQPPSSSPFTFSFISTPGVCARPRSCPPPSPSSAPSTVSAAAASRSTNAHAPTLPDDPDGNDDDTDGYDNEQEVDDEDRPRWRRAQKRLGSVDEDIYEPALKAILDLEAKVYAERAAHPMETISTESRDADTDNDEVADGSGADGGQDDTVLDA